MKLNSGKALAITLLATSTLFTNCVEDNKDLYDPTFETDNPMGDLEAPEGFDWSTIGTVKVSVEVSDEFNGQYYYLVEVLDGNPLETDQTYSVLAKGTAKKGEPFKMEVDYIKGNENLYIRQTDPRGRDKIQQFNIKESNGVINCSFNKSSVATAKSRINTRGADGITVPDMPSFTEQNYDTNKATEITSSSTVLKKDKEYIIKGTYKGSLNTTTLGNGEQTTVYVAGTWIPDDWSSQGLVHVIVLNEGKISAKNFTMNTGMDLTIQTGANVIASGTWRSATGITIVNYGKFLTEEHNTLNLELNSGTTLFNATNATIEATKITCLGGNINNQGYIKADKDFTLNSNVNLYNAKGREIKANNLNANSGGSVYNFGEIDIDETITMNTNSILYNGTDGEIEGKHYVASGSTNVNYGTMELDTYDNGNAGGAKLYNYCSLFIDDDIKIGGIIYMDHGVIADEKEDDKISYEGTDNITFYNNAVVTLANGSMIKGETISTGTDLDIIGEGDAESLLRASNKFEINGWGINFKGSFCIYGKIKIENGKYTADPTVVFSTHPDIMISGCGGQTEDPAPAPNPNPDDQEVTGLEDANKYTYLFEDQWPLYGDYDMNDIVLRVNKKKISLTSGKNKKVKEFELEMDLCAVGANKTIAAAIMLDGVPASAITQAVQYNDNNVPTTFKLTSMNIEEGQDYAVIPLFDNAHSFLDRQAGSFVNTVSGSSNNTKDVKNISFTIKFSNPTLDADAFNISKLNVFIITDRGNKRKEIHVAGYQPTKLANTDMFGNNNDGSSIASKKYYVSKQGLAWGIIAPQQFKWPLEYVNIETAYEQFRGWVTSGGKENEKWWNDFDVKKVFQTNKN